MKIRVFCSLLLLLLALLGCSDDNSKKPIEKSNRTTLVYMISENSLSTDSYKNIESIKQGALGNLNGGKLLIYNDPSDAEPELIEIYEERNRIQERVLKSYSEHDSASKEVMSKVILDAFSFYPSESRGLMLWSHGTSWMPVDQGIWTRAFGEDGPYQMEIYELREALRDSFFDYIIFDACFMSSVEVCYELRDKAKYIVGSPTEIFTDGFPYHLIINDLFSEEELEKSLKSICETYFSYYQERGEFEAYKHVSISLMKTEKMEELMLLCKQISAHTTGILDMDMEHVQVMMYQNSRKKLLYDFRDYYNQITNEEELKELDKLLSNIVIYKETADNIYTNRVSGGISFPMDREKYSGLSTYVPYRNTPILNAWYYENIDWARMVYGGRLPE